MGRYEKPEKWVAADGIDITKEQEDVIRETSSNISLVAGPGTGKTEVLAQKASYLLQTGICKFPHKILALCYKVDAAANIKSRVKKRCGPEFSGRFQSMTVDTFLISIIRRFHIFLPEWLKIDGDFMILDDISRDRGWLEEYTNRTGKVVQERYYSLIDISDNNKALWLYCVKKKEFDYAMCHSMAYSIVNASEDVRDIFSSTYKFIFLDEFQDMTERHYPTLCKMFCNKYNQVTAVGDFNQSIMGFAGAIPRIFNDFNSRFKAVEQRLTINHRSYPKIVKFINKVVEHLTPEGVSPLVYSSSKKDSNQSFVAIANFDSYDDEALYVIHCINKIMEEERSLNFNDFSLILKQTAADYFNQVEKMFSENSIKLRNEDAVACKNGVKIQDLMSNDFSKLVIYLLKYKSMLINVKERRELEYILSDILGIDINIPREAKKLNKLKTEIISSINIEDKNASEWISIIVETIGNRKIIKEYRNVKEFNKVKDSVTSLLQKCINENDSVNAALKDYLGEGSVKLMTTHKSKGLEFDTVFFVDFKEDSWWTSRPNQNDDTREESMRCFFVGLSRAKKRLFFTNPTKYWTKEIASIIKDSDMVIDYKV